MRLMAVEACLIEDRPARGGTVHQANATAGRRAGRQAGRHGRLLEPACQSTKSLDWAR
jgi:hypothetical protein